eukprot:g6092.t1
MYTEVGQFEHDRMHMEHGHGLTALDASKQLGHKKTPRVPVRICRRPILECDMAEAGSMLDALLAEAAGDLTACDRFTSRMQQTAADSTPGSEPPAVLESSETLLRTLTPFFDGEKRVDVQWERCALLAKEAGEEAAGAVIATPGVRSVVVTHMSDGTPCGTRIPLEFSGSEKKQVIIDRASKWHVTRVQLQWKLCKQWSEKKVYVGAKLVGKHQLAAQTRNAENLPARVKIPLGPSRWNLIKLRAMTKLTYAFRLFLVGTPYDVARAEASGTQKDKSVAALLQKLSINAPGAGSRDAAPTLAFVLSDEELQDGAEVAKARAVGILQSATRGIRPPSFSRWIRCAADMARNIVAWVLGLLDKGAQLHFIGKEWAGIRVGVTMMIVCMLVRPVEHFQATAAKKITVLSAAETHARFYEEVGRVFILLKVDSLHLLMGLMGRTTRAEAEHHSEAARHALHVIAGSFYGRVVCSVFRKHFAFLQECGGIEQRELREQFARTFCAKELKYESGNPASIALVHIQKICKQYLGGPPPASATSSSSTLPFPSVTDFLDELSEAASRIRQDTLPVEGEHATLQRSQDSRAPRGIAAIDSENVGRKLGRQIAAREAEVEAIDEFARADWRFEHCRRKLPEEYARADLMTKCGDTPGHSIGDANRLATREQLGDEAWGTYVEAAASYNTEARDEFEKRQEELEREFWKKVDENHDRRRVLMRELELYADIKSGARSSWDKYKHRERLAEERTRLAVPAAAQFALGSVTVWKKEASNLVKSIIDLIDLTSLHRPAAKKVAEEFPDEMQVGEGGGEDNGNKAQQGSRNAGAAGGGAGAAGGSTANQAAPRVDVDEWEEVDMGGGTHLVVVFTFPDLTSEALLVVWVLRRPMKFVALRLVRAGASVTKYKPVSGDPKGRHFTTDFDFTAKHASGCYSLKSAKSRDDGTWEIAAEIEKKRKVATDLNQKQTKNEVARPAPLSLDALHPLDRQLLEIRDPDAFAAAAAHASSSGPVDPKSAAEGSCGLRLIKHVSRDFSFLELGGNGASRWRLPGVNGGGHAAGAGPGASRGASAAAVAAGGGAALSSLGAASLASGQVDAGCGGKPSTAAGAGAPGGEGSNYFCITELQAKEILRRRRKITEQVEHWADDFLPAGKWKIADGGVRRLGYKKSDANDMQWATCLLLAWCHLQQWIIVRSGKCLRDISHRADPAAVRVIAEQYAAMVDEVTQKALEIRGELDDDEKMELAAYCSMPASEFAYLTPLAACGRAEQQMNAAEQEVRLPENALM